MNEFPTVATAAAAAPGGLAVTTWAPSEAAPHNPDRPDVVLLHGFTQTAQSWSTIASALASAGFRVLAVDLPGHGGSSHIRVTDLWDCAAAAISAVRPLLGGPALLVGYSLGGRVALHAALKAPEMWGRLVLIGATAGIDDGGERAARVAADEALATGVLRDGVPSFLKRWLAQSLFATLPADAAGTADRLANTAEGLAMSLRSCGTGRQEPLWNRIGDIAVETTIAAGALDEKFCALGARLATSIPNARLHVIPAAGHACHLERPEAIRALIISAS